MDKGRTAKKFKAPGGELKWRGSRLIELYQK
jgi:hypothetical protein